MEYYYDGVLEMEMLEKVLFNIKIALQSFKYDNDKSQL